jgi:hypothetical protein
VPILRQGAARRLLAACQSRRVNAKSAKVFWFFFSKKNGFKQTLLFKKEAKTFSCWGEAAWFERRVLGPPLCGCDAI